MLRFIVKRHIVNLVTDYNDISYETIDAEVPELQKVLCRGGIGDGFDTTQLIGVTICHS